MFDNERTNVGLDDNGETCHQIKKKYLKLKKIIN